MVSLNSMADVNVVVWGRGEPVVFVHGSGPAWGEKTFARQRPLAEEYRLLLVDRRGFGDSPPTERVDFNVDAADIASLLGKGAHLVGHSFGGVVSLLAAGRRPDAVKSLTVIEPPAFGIARGDVAVENFVRRLTAVYETARSESPEEFWTNFLRAFGFEEPPTFHLTEKGVKGIRSTMTRIPPWDAEIPLDTLAATHFPKLVISGGWNNVPVSAKEIAGEALKAVCDVLQDRLRAERFVFENAAHNPQFLGKLFNERLKTFFRSTRSE